MLPAAGPVVAAAASSTTDGGGKLAGPKGSDLILRQHR